MNAGSRSSHHPMQLHAQTMLLRWLRLPGPRRSLPAKAPTLVKRTASTRASSRSRRRVAIATGSICATSPNRRVSYAAASPRIPTTSDLPSRARLAARSAMSSRSRSVGGITARCIAHATSAPGGSRAGIDPIKIARRLWKETRGMGKGRAEPPASPRPHGAAASPDPQERGHEDRRKDARRNSPHGCSRLAAPSAGSGNDDVGTSCRLRGGCLQACRCRSAEQTPPITPPRLA